MVQLSTLKTIAVFGGFASLAGATYITRKIHENLENGEYYKISLSMLRKYGPAVELFGQPIKTRRMDLGDVEKTKIDGLNAKLTVPVRGPKNKGILYAWASREKPGDSWTVNRLDLEVDSLNKRWTFYKDGNWIGFSSH